MLPSQHHYSYLWFQWSSGWVSLGSDSQPFPIVNLIGNIIKKANYKISSPHQEQGCKNKKSTLTVGREGQVEHRERFMLVVARGPRLRRDETHTRWAQQWAHKHTCAHAQPFPHCLCTFVTLLIFIILKLKTNTEADSFFIISVRGGNETREGRKRWAKQKRHDQGKERATHYACLTQNNWVHFPSVLSNTSKGCTCTKRAPGCILNFCFFCLLANVDQYYIDKKECTESGMIIKINHLAWAHWHTLEGHTVLNFLSNISIHWGWGQKKRVLSGYGCRHDKGKTMLKIRPCGFRGQITLNNIKTMLESECPRDLTKGLKWGWYLDWLVRWVSSAGSVDCLLQYTNVLETSAPGVNSIASQRMYFKQKRAHSFNPLRKSVSFPSIKAL